MVKKTKELKEVTEEEKDIFKAWIESTGEMLEKMALISTEAAPQKYKEFYDEWIKTYQNTFGKYYPIPTLKSNREALEKFLSSAEEFSKMYKTWITEMEENAEKTKKILEGKPDPEKYKQCYDLWMKSYEKIHDELSELPSQENAKGYFQWAKLWRKSYTQMFGSLNDAMLKISQKMTEISKGEMDPEAYKEFYTLWMDAYKDIHAKYARSNETSTALFENFIESINIYLTMYRSWIAALEDMSEKVEEMSKQIPEAQANKEFYSIWLKMYQKAFDNFFEDMPIMKGPMKHIIEPVKVMARMYEDAFTQMSNVFMKPAVSSASAYPGKYKK